MTGRGLLLVTGLVVSLLLPGTACRRQNESEPDPDRLERSPEAGSTPQSATDPQDLEQTPPQTPPAEVVTRSRTPEDFRMGDVGSVLLLRIFSDRFAGLPVRDRILAYHLARAVLAGRDIVFDQLHRRGLEVRQLLEQIRLHNSDLPPEIDKRVGHALELLWLNNGMYHVLSHEKLQLPLDYEQLRQAALAASSLGAELGQGHNESVEETLSRLRGFMFDPRVDAVLADARPSLGQDLLAGSHLNLYSGVRVATLKKFAESFPQNSRLVRVDDRVVEEVYRAGDRVRKIPRGRYFRELQRIVNRLQHALVVARRPSRLAITQLVESFRTGSPQAFGEACRLLSDRREAVEFSLGFADRNIDPRGRKGLFTGFVAIRDQAASARLEGLLRQLPGLLAKLPGREQQQAAGTGWQAVAAELLVAVGRDGPQPWPAAYLCGGAAAGELPSRLVLFANVIESRAQGQLAPLVPLAGLAATAPPQLLTDTVFLATALREMAWMALQRRGQQRLRRRMGTLAPVLAWLEAEAAALWWLTQAPLDDSGLAGDERREQARKLLLARLVAEQVMLEPMKLRRPRWLARRLLVNYLVEDAGLGLEPGNEPPRLGLADASRLTRRLERLLKRLNSIQARADRLAAASLVEAQAAELPRHLSAALRPWLEKHAWRPQAALVMPKLRPQFSPSRKVVDVSVAHEESLERQMLRYRRY